LYRNTIKAGCRLGNRDSEPLGVMHQRFDVESVDVLIGIACLGHIRQLRKLAMKVIDCVGKPHRRCVHPHRIP